MDGAINQLQAAKPGDTPPPASANKWTAIMVAWVLAMGVAVFLILVLAKITPPDAALPLTIKLVGGLAAVGVTSASLIGARRNPDALRRVRRTIKRMM